MLPLDRDSWNSSASFRATPGRRGAIARVSEQTCDKGHRVHIFLGKRASASRHKRRGRANWAVNWAVNWANAAPKRNGGRHCCQPPLIRFRIVSTAALFASSPMICIRGFAQNRPAVGLCPFRRRIGRPPCGGRPHLKCPSSTRLFGSCDLYRPLSGLHFVPCLTCGSSWESRADRLAGIGSVRFGSVPQFDP